MVLLIEQEMLKVAPFEGNEKKKTYLQV